eukprot:scaffold2923_cov313-Pinguiococcus_pyrenoidosus.AAC.27
MPSSCDAPYWRSGGASRGAEDPRKDLECVGQISRSHKNSPLTFHSTSWAASAAEFLPQRKVKKASKNTCGRSRRAGREYPSQLPTVRYLVPVTSYVVPSSRFPSASERRPSMPRLGAAPA